MALSLSKLKFISSLREKKFREAEGLFLAEGERLVRECFLSNWEISEFYITKEKEEQYDDLLEIALEKNIPVFNPSPKDFERFSGDKSPAGIAVLVKIKQISHDSFFKNSKNYIILDKISDPGNLGTIIRTADWFGFKNLILLKGSCEVLNPKVIKASMGAVFRINYLEDAETEKIIAEIRKQKITIYAADLHGKDIRQIKQRDNFALILGNEAAGLDDKLRNAADDLITIPGKGGMESLNVAISAGILMFYLSLNV